MFKNIIAITLLLSSSLVMAAEQYTAVISCGQNGKNLNVLACFTDTDLKITKNNRSKVYKVYQLNGLGQTYQDGMHIQLPESFEIMAQNSQDHLVLGVKILDSNNQVVFEDQAGKWGVIKVGN